MTSKSTIDIADLGDLPTTRFAPTGSPEGRAWIRHLPQIVDDVCHTWDLDLESTSGWSGFGAFVLPVRRDGVPLVLKCAWLRDDIDDVVPALVEWGGRGAVHLVQSDPLRGVLLLERLDINRPLSDVAVADALVVTGQLIAQLAIPARISCPSTQSEAADIARTLFQRQSELGNPIPSEWLALTVGACAGLTSRRTSTLIHADLHGGNVMACDRPGVPWAAVDPRVQCGDAERSVAEVMWTRVDDLDGPDAVRDALGTVVDAGGLSFNLATSWAFVRAIDYWLWGLAHDLTIDPERCRRVADALAQLVNAVDS